MLNTGAMTVELPTAGEQFEAYLVEDRYGVLWVQEAHGADS
jgi:hypothetical protein